MIPCSSKSKILELLLTLEQMFSNNPRLQQSTVQSADSSENETRVLYLEHMSKETIDVAKSHTSWMTLAQGAQSQDIQRGQNPFNF